MTRSVCAATDESWVTITIVDRIRRQQDVMAQINNHAPEQIMHGLFTRRVSDTVLDAMTDNEKRSLEVLDNRESERRFALLVLKILTDANILGKSNYNFERAAG